MDFEQLENLPLSRIKVRGLVKCGDEYIFIQRTKFGKSKKYLVFPGGRVKKSDRIEGDKDNLGRTLKSALTRELEEELAAHEIVIGEVMAVSKPLKHDREVLFSVEVGSINWESRTGKEFSDPNKGTYDLVRLKELTKDVLNKKGYNLKPKQWRKIIREDRS